MNDEQKRSAPDLSEEHGHRALRSVFLEEAEDLLSKMGSCLTSLCEDPCNPQLLAEVAAGGHTLRGSASLAHLPALTRAGAVLERAALMAARAAERNRAAARALVRETRAALAPARRMVSEARAGRTGSQRFLLREFEETFSPAHQEGIRNDHRPGGRAAPSAPPRPQQRIRGDEGDPGGKPAPDLRAVFREEMRDLLADVPDLLRGLADPAEQIPLCADLGRIFHTLKGSAAMVGLDECRTLARLLEESCENATANPRLLPLGPGFAQGIYAPLERIFVLAELEPPHEALELLRETTAASVVDAGDEDGSADGAGDEDGSADGAAHGPQNHAPATSPSSTAVEPELMEAFALDADEALEASEAALATLVENPDDRAPLHTLLRQFHTLKGAAAAVGLERIAAQMHSGETLVEGALEKGIPGTADLFTRLLLEMLDSVTGLLEEARGAPPRHRILEDIDARIARVLAQATPGVPEPPTARSTTAAKKTLPTPQPTPPETGPEGDTSVVRVHAGRLDLLMNRVSELVVSRTRMEDALGAVQELRDKLNLDRLQLNETIEGFRSFEFGTTASPGPDDAPAAIPLSSADFSDLEFDKYDDFNVLARSLVELAADTGEVLEQLGHVLDGLGDEGRQISKVSSSLQRTVSAMRLQSLDTLFRRLQRAIRDAARQTGRDVETTTIGGDIQIDRGLLESLYGPLLHVVRNAISHGIEPGAERTAAGKDVVGHLTLEALQRPGFVEILVRDDGRGLDFAAIERKARRRGLLAPGADADRDELARMIFRPGFSTTERVTDLAGRGIGMDVVASEIEHLRGSVWVDSRDGRGASFGITVPLATMIDHVLVVRAGREIFALPQAPIETVLSLEPDQVLHDPAGLRLRVLGETLRALPLSCLSPAAAGTPSTALVIRAGAERIALLVDGIEGQREAVIRPLGRIFSGHPLITSATFAGDGRVVFVLDASRLPLLVGQPTPSRPVAAANPPPRPTAAGAPILWVDDSISVRKLARSFCSAGGWNAETAVDGMDALEKLRGGTFRVVVTDLEMPRMHGYALLQEIRGDPRLCDLPVVVCSSRSSEKHRHRAREAGASGYLTKPFTPEALDQALRGFLGQPACDRAAD